MTPRCESQADAAIHSARAALLLATVLLALALPGIPLPPSACDHPLESAAQDAQTVRVACSATPRPEAALRGPARLLFGQRLDLNRATARSLEALPAVGPRRAAAIVAARAEAPFRALADLQRVSGIGPRTVEALAGWAEVESGGPSTD